MAKFYDDLNTDLQAFIAEQKMFFVATAAREGRINLSPKGMDCFRVLDNLTVAYLDLTGSGNETAAHLHADGRMTIMFCSFGDKPNVLRLHGRGEVIGVNTPAAAELLPLFPALPGARQIIVLRAESVQTACGFAVPMYEFKEERSLLVDWASKKGDDELRAYRAIKNRVSIDGLPTGLDE